MEEELWKEILCESRYLVSSSIQTQSRIATASTHQSERGKLLSKKPHTDRRGRTYYCWLRLAKENLTLISFLKTQPLSGTEALGFA